MPEIPRAAEPSGARAAEPAGEPLFEPLLRGAALELDRGPVNVARRLDAEALAQPDADAVRWRARGAWRARSFSSTASMSARVGSGLLNSGLRPGERVCVFVRPGPDLIAIVYGLLRSGLVPVLIDPGMGARRLVACARSMQPAAFIGVAAAHAARRLFAKHFQTVRLAVTVGLGPRFGAVPIAEIEARGSAERTVAPTVAQDQAAILFTSGSTGPPKGVVVTHGIFEAQTRALETLYGFARGGVDVACFPLFALFDNALGMTSVFPELDPSRPARCKPAKLVAAIAENEATVTFGSPAIWRRVVPWARAEGANLEPLQRILIAGAPVPPALIEDLRALLGPAGDVHTPYGATESLPVATISGAEVLEPDLRALVDSGRGTCVGRPAPGIELAVLRVTEGPLPSPRADLALAPGALGELAVRGPVVTPSYAEAPDATLGAKIPDPRGGLWHRMGDLGFADEEGRLWFCGRVAHRLQTSEGLLPPVPLENVFNAHPGVARSALVGVGEPGAQLPVLIVQTERGAVPKRQRERFAAELLRAATARCPEARCVQHVLFRKDFPVDVRHNAKIHRPELRLWATAKLGGRP